MKFPALLVTIVWLLALIISPEPHRSLPRAEAATFTVDTLVDESDGDFSAGDFSLREAVEQANAAGGVDVIDFSVSGTINVGSQLDVTDDLSINGSGITLDGGSATRIMSVGLIATVTINDLTFQNGSFTFGTGGAIYNDGTLTITGGTFSDNSAGAGGAIHNSGTLTITNSTSSGNQADFDGGAIYNNNGTVAISSSTFSNNSAGVIGGAIYNSNGTVGITNSTFSDSTANNLGGAIYIYGTTTITSSTFSGNTANLGGTLYRGGGTLNVASTLMVGGDCFGSPITDLGNNLSFNATSCPGTVADPGLGPLQNNGGPIDTMMPALIGPAVDAYVTPCATSTDQRGVNRPQGFCDIGATEQNGNTTPLIASAACNGPNLDVTIAAGDGPFNIITSAGINTPVNGVGIGTTTINGPEKWDNLMVTETGGNMQSINLGTFKCRTDERPVPVSPAHRARITNAFPNFSWTAITIANNYRVFVFDNASAASRTVDIRQNSGGPTTLVLTTPLPDGRLFWRVRGRQNRVWSLWSVRFTLFKDPVVPLMVSTPVPTVELSPPSGDDSLPTPVPTIGPAPTFPAPPNSR